VGEQVVHEVFDEPNLDGVHDGANTGLHAQWNPCQQQHHPNNDDDRAHFDVGFFANALMQNVPRRNT